MVTDSESVSDSFGQQSRPDWSSSDERPSGEAPTESPLATDGSEPPRPGAGSGLLDDSRAPYFRD